MSAGPDDRARVVAAFGAECLVERQPAVAEQASVRKRAGRPVCGDYVQTVTTPQTLVVEEIEPRRNEFARADRRGRQQVIAANLDHVVIVVAPRPEPTRDLINRYLVACESLGIPAAICVNKRDLVTDPAAWDRRMTLYRELGYDFVYASAKAPDGLDDLLDILHAGTNILVGQSGVGKSSIIDRLLPDRQLETGDISTMTGKGRHTTTTTTLYHLPGGGELIDSPGVWEYGIWTMDVREIAAGFREFDQYAGQCRFADCSHRVEPGCAIEAGVVAGDIHGERLASYRRIVEAQEGMRR